MKSQVEAAGLAGMAAGFFFCVAVVAFSKDHFWGGLASLVVALLAAAHMGVLISRAPRD
jgi:VIT1/CCC1 family predicted Fe2+/Mn2+ transporter